MRGSRRKGRRPGTWELRIDAGLDPLTGRRLQRSLVFEGTSREADAKLAELTVEAGRGRIQSIPSEELPWRGDGNGLAASARLPRPIGRGDLGHVLAFLLRRRRTIRNETIAASTPAAALTA